MMILFRKYRRLISFIHQHFYLCLSLATSISILLIFSKVIIYYIYIRLLDTRPYEKAVTFWSTDFHIR